MTKLLYKLSIKSRLILLSAILLLIMAGTGVLGLLGMQHTGDSLEHIYTDSLVPTGQVSQVIDLMNENRAQLLLSLQHDPESYHYGLHDHELSRHLQNIERNRAQLDTLWQALEASELSTEAAQLLQQLQQQRDDYVQNALRPAMEQLQAGRFLEANRIMLSQAEPTLSAAKVTAAQLLELQLNSAGELYRHEMRNYAFARLLIIGLLILGALIALGLSWLTISGINRSVRSLYTASQSMAEGDLRVEVHNPGTDELAQIGNAFNLMASSVRESVRELSSVTNQLAAAAEETSAISAQTGGGVRQQQLETDQVATAMNEMTATVMEVARNAGGAASAAQEADLQSQAGREVVAQSIQAMELLAEEVESAAQVIQKLEADSDAISGVLTVIQAVAEQTNLLALNAAIEAARAGEHGRGFAVVADEVRTLASRTQQSTTEIRQIIERLQNGTHQAVNVMQLSRDHTHEVLVQVSSAGNRLDSITSSVSTINDMNTQIASAAEEQSAVAEEINRNLVSVTEIARQTSEASQQNALTSDELARLASGLQQIVGRFQF